MKNKLHNSSKNRRNFGIVLFFLTIFLFVFIGLRFTWIMVRGEVDGENLGQNIHKLYSASNLVEAERGTIYDRNQNLIATSAKSYDMVAILTDKWSNESKPVHVQDPKAVAQTLSNHLSITEEKALEILTSDAAQVEFGNVGKNLSYDTVTGLKEELEEKGLKGLNFHENQTRLYPNGVFASHIVGLAQKNSNENSKNPEYLEGVMGIEDYFNQELTGENGTIEYQKDRFGYALPGTEAQTIEGKDGNNVHLTLDKRLQIHVENVLTEIDEKYHPKAMTATVMDPKSGEIIASSQRPTFNATSKENIDKTWQNLLVEYTYEPGSTFKAITLAAAIEEGVFDPTETFKSGKKEIAGSVIRDVKPEGWGEITYLEGVYRSSNIAFGNLVEKMGLDTWKNYIEAFGFETPTGITLPNESSGSNPFETPIQKLNTGFGQGITVTPVQMLQAFTAIANEGQIQQPKIVSSISDSSSEDQEAIELIQKEAPISPETAKKTLDILSQGVESDVGTGRIYGIENYQVAAKTGTAQLVNPDTGKYYTDVPDYLYSVMAMASADDPQVIIYITVQQPELNEQTTYGHQVVQEVYQPIMKRALDYLSSNEDKTQPREKQKTEMKMPDLRQTDLDEAKNLMGNHVNDLAIVGSGDKIVQQYPQAQTPLVGNERSIAVTDGAMSMPDLSGWSRNDVLKLGQVTGVNFEFVGEGYVVDQSRGPNSFIESGSEVEIHLDPNQELIENKNEELSNDNQE